MTNNLQSRNLTPLPRNPEAEDPHGLLVLPNGCSDLGESRGMGLLDCLRTKDDKEVPDCMTSTTSGVHPSRPSVLR